MSKGLLNSFKNGTIPETVKNTEENIKEEVVATPVEPAKEESELEKLKRELAEARKKAEEAEMSFALGYTDSIHDLAVAQQKANISLQYTVKVTNSVVTAYKELMNMQL